MGCASCLHPMTRQFESGTQKQEYSCLHPSQATPTSYSALHFRQRTTVASHQVEEIRRSVSGMWRRVPRLASLLWDIVLSSCLLSSRQMGGTLFLGHKTRPSAFGMCRLGLPWSLFGVTKAQFGRLLFHRTASASCPAEQTKPSEFGMWRPVPWSATPSMGTVTK